MKTGFAITLVLGFYLKIERSPFQLLRFSNSPKHEADLFAIAP
ncbi:MAG: hypothetical protein AB4062_09340 [Crocosphaera sp.]